MGMDTRLGAIIDVGASTTSLVIHRNGVPLFVRILMMGGQDVTERLISDLGVNLPTAESLKREAGLQEMEERPEPDTPAAVISEVVNSLVDELRGSLDYYMATGVTETLAGVTLTGGGSLIPGLVSRLERSTGLPVQRGNTLLRLGVGRSGLSEDHLMFADPLAAAAVGLAVRSV
jgi:type IV pilus assembly protein PilM